MQVTKLSLSPADVKLVKTFLNHSFEDLNSFLKSTALVYTNTNANDDGSTVEHTYTEEQKQSLAKVLFDIKEAMGIEEDEYNDYMFSDQFFKDYIDEVVSTASGNVINLSNLDFASLLSDTHTPEKKIVGVGLITGVMEKSDSKYGSTRTEEIKEEQRKRITVSFSVVATSDMLDKSQHNFYFEEQSTDFLKYGVDRGDGMGKTEKSGILNLATLAKIKYPKNAEKFTKMGGSFSKEHQNNVETLNELLTGVYVTFDILEQKAGKTTYALTKEEAERMCKNRGIMFSKTAFNTKKKLFNGKEVVYVYHLSDGLRLSSFATTTEKAQEQAIKNHNKLMERLSDLSLDEQTAGKQAAIEGEKLVGLFNTFNKIQQSNPNVTLDQFRALYEMVKK